ncbi:DNA/RNA polymerase [Schizothecium vesticola]|uniref:DNA polymerase eta n=1 Tax=Schizothecium vesticola TaxID=314040 RepID=A0AA40F9G9_9PEZI|nr:DNA/RNA polymerase [Schizothecium vesticola]
MSSPPRFFRDSSPAGAPGYKRSQFTYRHLAQLASSSSTCPLRVVSHIDLDCFYAQVEMVRLGIPEDKPLAVQQWQGLIAVNYPARAFGIGRHCTVTEARQLCPDLIAQHVATWREGDENFAYRPDAAEHIATDKVSLDPYRLECRRILAVIKDHLPARLQKVEKASIDEVFVDLSAHVYEILLERFPELARPPPYDDPSEQLPMPPLSALDWQADALVDLDSEQAELDDPDWDDVTILIGSEIVRNVRAAIKEKLHYTCSAGVAKNKLLSKLGSAHKKPNQQTVIRNRAVQHFLSEFKFTKIRNLGGKLGEEISRVFNTELVSELLSVPIEQLKSRLGDDTSVWVYNTIRGIDTSEVNPRTQIKSMLSAKSFRPSIDSREQATKWLRIFAADIFSRLVEEGVLENKRRPKSANLHFRQGAAGGGQTRSRQMSIPQGKPIDEEMLFEIAKTLLCQIAQEGRVWPCSNLSLSIGGFEDGITGNMGIGAFLVKGPEAQVLKATTRSAFEPGGAGDTVQPPEKRRRTDEGGIQRFLTKREANREADARLGSDVAAPRGGASSGSEHMPGVTVRPSGPHHQAPVAAHLCSRCPAGFASPEESREHQDWHFAKDLHEQERVGLALVSREPAAASSSHTGTMRSAAAPPKRGVGRPKKTERGQSKLNFG